MPIGAPTTIHNALPPARLSLLLRTQPQVILATLVRHGLSTLPPRLVNTLPQTSLPALRRGLGGVVFNSFSGPVYQRPGKPSKGQQYP